MRSSRGRDRPCDSGVASGSAEVVAAAGSRGLRPRPGRRERREQDAHAGVLGSSGASADSILGGLLASPRRTVLSRRRRHLYWGPDAHAPGDAAAAARLEHRGRPRHRGGPRLPAGAAGLLQQGLLPDLGRRSSSSGACCCSRAARRLPSPSPTSSERRAVALHATTLVVAARWPGSSAPAGPRLGPAWLRAIDAGALVLVCVGFCLQFLSAPGTAPRADGPLPARDAGADPDPRARRARRVRAEPGARGPRP